nr:MAG TPA: hypothetical protein [Caudoviricetes sp.]
MVVCQVLCIRQRRDGRRVMALVIPCVVTLR